MPRPNYRRPTLKGTHLVYFAEEGTGKRKTFDFSTFQGSDVISGVLARGFARVTGPGGSQTSLSTASTTFLALERAAAHFARSQTPPQKIEDLRAHHALELRLMTSGAASDSIRSLRLCIGKNPRLDEGFRRAMLTPLRRKEAGSVSAYSLAELRQIKKAARTVVRAALYRIRSTHSELDSWRSQPMSHAKGWSRLALLDFVIRTGDFPRDRSGKVIRVVREHGGSRALLQLLSPSIEEVAALIVLLIIMTGQNLSVVVNLGANSSRSTVPEDSYQAAQVGVRKLRRGPSRSDSTISLTSFNEWDSQKPQASDDFNSAFGVFAIALEIGSVPRAHMPAQPLLCYQVVGRQKTLGPFRSASAPLLERWHGHVDPATQKFRAVDSRRLRRTYLEAHQRPVNHSAATLANSYLSQDATSLPDYQEVVHEVLSEEYKRTRSGVRTLTQAQIDRAAVDPEEVSDEVGIGSGQFASLLSGELDTVATACTDNSGGAQTEVGQPCKASFLLCLDCPCARSEPRHIPAQASLAKELLERKKMTDPTTWVRRFGKAFDQVSDLLHQQGVQIADLDTTLDPSATPLIKALLDGDLDLQK